MRFNVFQKQFAKHQKYILLKANIKKLIEIVVE